MALYFASLALFTSAYSQSDFFGKLIFVALFLLSLLSWTVLVYKVQMTRQVRLFARHFEEKCEKHKHQLLEMEVERGVNVGQKHKFPHLFAEVFTSIKQKTEELLSKNLFFAKKQGEESAEFYLSKEDVEFIEAHALTAISKQSKKLEKDLFVLATVVTLAPFLGLLGTVWGILVTFNQLHQGGSVGSNSLVLGGLSTALTTTVIGLLIAIPALIAYNYLKNSTDKLISDSEDFLYSLLSTIELQYRRSSGGYRG